jgi:hypothetical protein
MWKTIAVALVILVALDMYFAGSKYMNGFIKLASEIARWAGFR